MAPLLKFWACIAIFIPVAIAQDEPNVVYYNRSYTTEGSQYIQNLNVVIQSLLKDVPPANPKQKAYIYGQGTDMVYGYGECNSSTSALCLQCLTYVNNTLRNTVPLATGAWRHQVYSTYSCYLRYYSGPFESYVFDSLNPVGSPPSDSPPAPGTNPPNQSPNSTVIVVPVVCILLVLAVLVAFFCIRAAKRKRKPDSQDWRAQMDENPVRQFTYSDLSYATKGFSEHEVLGEGGFGKVYKGVLASDGSTVAVKVMSQAHEEGVKQFLAELSVISQVRHRNLVGLRGCCYEGQNLILVYDYMQNGSLDQYLSPNKFLGWSQRFEIIKNVAEGLAYLHGGWERRIVHRDIKPANVLLDANFVARLGDFGLAKLMEDAKFVQTMTVAGTMGYIAPELAYLGKASEKSDIYSFGILLLVIACGRPTLDSTLDEPVLSDWIWNAQARGELLSVVDPGLGNNYDNEQVLLVLSLGLICIHLNPESRPTSRRCCLILNDEAPLPPVPPSRPIVNMAYNHSHPTTT